ncbi:Uncharacterised protein [Mycobacteroides abscessus subsp. abscessus]|nr:Uncharacterised protein [Mycobacteroides abscessus subsp. abscessus]
MRFSRSRATSRSVRPGRIPPVSISAASAVSAAAQALSRSRTSESSLTSRSFSIRFGARTNSTSVAASANLSNPSTVTTWLSKPARPAGACATRAAPYLRSIRARRSGTCAAAWVRYLPSVHSTVAFSSGPSPAATHSAAADPVKPVR